MEELVVRNGHTDRITMQLLVNGRPVNLTGFHHVRLDMSDKLNKIYRFSSVDVSSCIEIIDSENGEISFTPNSDKVFIYSRSPYKVYVWAYQWGSRRTSFPNEDSAIIKVLKEY